MAAASGIAFEHLHATQFAAVNKQIENGLFVVKRATQYLRKATNAQDAFAKEIIKITKQEDSNLKSIQGDAMLRHVHASVEIQDLMSKMADRHARMADQVVKTVVEPLEAFLKKAEDRRKKIVSGENKLTSSIKDMRSQVAKERQSCFKHFEECKEVKKEMDDEERKEPSNPKAMEKLQKKLIEKREKAKKQFKKFEEMREKALLALDDYYSKGMPDLLAQMSELELDRMKSMKLYFEHFSQLETECTAPLPASQALANMVNVLNAESELKNCVNQMTVTFGDVTAREPLEVDMPCSSELIMTDQWLNGGDSGVSAAASSSVGKPRATPASLGFGKPEPSVAHSQISYPGEVRLWVRAMFDYPEGQPGDLTFQTDDIIGVIDAGTSTPGHVTIDPNNPTWWTGFVHGNDSVGRFPNNYTEEVVDEVLLAQLNANNHGSAAAAQPAPEVKEEAPASGGLYARALYDYEFEPTGDAATDSLGYISFRAGDMIEVTSQAEGDWWHGSLNGQSGYFPANLVQLQ